MAGIGERAREASVLGGLDRSAGMPKPFTRDDQPITREPRLSAYFCHTANPRFRSRSVSAGSSALASSKVIGFSFS